MAGISLVFGFSGFYNQFGEVCPGDNGRSVGFDVGVHCGSAVVGNVGCDVRMDYTAIGDTVNTSARLETNAKKGQVLISDTLYERLKGRLEVEDVGEIPLKGKSKGVFVYSVKNLIGGVIEDADEKNGKKISKKSGKQTEENSEKKTEANTEQESADDSGEKTEG